jgi:hypothetical protein
MSDINVKVEQSDIKVRVGQQNSIKILGSVSGGSAFSQNADNAVNVIGGIASVTQLNVSGISTFVGLSTFNNDVYIGGSLYISSDLNFDEFTARNANITGIATISGGLYYGPFNTGGVAYFNSSGLLVSTGSTSSSINYSNYILSTNNSGVPTWANVIDGGTY